jgi:hypothetical protein
MATKQPKPGAKAARKPKKYNATKELKAIARERVGTVPASRVVTPKADRRKPKHKQDLLKTNPADSI